MKFEKTEISGCFIIAPEPRGDERGFFQRIYCRDEFSKHGLPADLEQINNSWSADAGTLRGLHYQVAPHGEDKLVRCVRGAIYDVVVDCRENSPTFKQWVGAELTADNRLMMFAPKGCAHGFLTLVDGTELIYGATESYHPGEERVLRWNDLEIGIEWPIVPKVLSEKDRTAADFEHALHVSNY